jgi:hypothetical protein
VDRSEAGTCVLRTQCDPKIDLEKTEFAFLCVLKDGEVQKHSYGEGGFGAAETFDSSVACEQCLLPTMALSLESATAEAGPDKVDKKEDEDDKADDADDDDKNVNLKAEKKDEKKADKKKEGLPTDLNHKDLMHDKNESKREVYLKSVFAKHPNSSVPVNGSLKATSKYGPDGCISTYVSPKNTCMMKTDCKKQAESGALKNYDFGLTCVDEDGKSTRHLFGTNSFDSEETFDTLIDCKLCIGLDVSKMEKKESLATAVGKLEEEVKALATGIKEVQGNVSVLNKEVFKDDKKEKAPGFMLHKVEQKETEEVGKNEAEVTDSTDEEEAPAPAHHKHHKKHHSHLAHKRTKKAKHHHKHHKKAHHKKHHVDDEEASDDTTQVPVPDASDEEPKPAVDDSEPAEAGEDEDADGW